MKRYPKILLVTYGGGHVEMCLPVMRAIRRQVPDSDVRIMALTTAFSVARLAGETPMGYRDFSDLPGFDGALQYGAKLLSGLGHLAVAQEESIAYLGINFLEWVKKEGEEVAWRRWAECGRHGFFPVNFFRAVIKKLEIDMVITTNAPRSEQAAIEAATGLGVPCLSMIDLFALPGDPFLCRQIYADRLTVLTDATRENLIMAGIDSGRIFVTGNPAFDVLTAEGASIQGKAWRAAKGWNGKNIVFWAGHLEPLTSECSELAGSGLGDQVQQTLVDWVKSRPDVCLVVRYHPNEWRAFVRPPVHPRIHWNQPDIEPLLPPLLASDQVVVQITTVGVQAYVVGKRVINIGYSPYVLSSGLDYSLLGISDRADDLAMLIQLLEQGLVGGNIMKPYFLKNGNAAQAVASHAIALAKERIA